MKKLLLVLLFVTLPVTAAERPEWYPDFFQMVGKVTTIDLSQRILILGDTELRLADNVKAHSMTSRFYPIDRVKQGEGVGLGFKDDGPSPLVTDIWILGSRPEDLLKTPGEEVKEPEPKKEEKPRFGGTINR